MRSIRLILLTLLLLFPSLGHAENFTSDENKIFSNFITSALGAQDPQYVATVFGQLLTGDVQANAQIRGAFSLYIDGEIAKAQATKDGLAAQKAAAESELDNRISTLTALKEKLEAP